MIRSTINEFLLIVSRVCASLILFWLILATSCTAHGENLVATHTSTSPSPPPTFPSATLPTQTTMTPSIPSSSHCPEIQEDIQPNLAVDFDSVDEDVVNYLNDGGDPLKLQMEGSYDKTYTQVQVVDLDGDSSDEVVLTSSYPADSVAMFVVYRCGQMDYRQVMNSKYDYASDIRIEFAGQLFSSRPPFVFMIVQYDRGAIQDYIAVGWNGKSWQIMKIGTGFFPSELVLFDQDGDGIQEIFIQTRTSVTPGGGIGRVQVNTYAWNGIGFALSRSDYPPGTDRVHYLQDAQIALDNGNPLLAISYYKIAAENPDLPSLPTTFESLVGQADLADEYQRAFAYFRTASIWLYLQRSRFASQVIEEMGKVFPEGTPGAEFIAPAELLLSRVEEGEEYQEACIEAGFALDYYYPEVMSVHIGSWGGGPSYSEGVEACTIY